MKITFQKSDFEGNTYGNPEDCAMARAIRRVEPGVKRVSSKGWTDKNNIVHPLTKRGGTLDFQLAVLSRKEWRSEDNPFIGKTYYV